MRIIVDQDIPFIKGRLEKAGIETVYTGQWGFEPELVKDADALLIRTRTRCNESLLRDSNVKLVATATIGTDQIDTDWCEKNGITVRNAPGCNAPGVAQYVWASLLRIFNDIKITKNGYRPVVGIVGCGNVGSIVRDWGEKLGMKILVSDPPKGMDYPLERLLRESDAVTLHTPLDYEGEYATYHLIGERELGQMRDGTILVNAARGPVVDFKALKKEVSKGRLRAVIDTWEDEPTVDEELLANVEYGTFHIAGYSYEGKQRATRMALEAVEETFSINIDKSGLEGNYKGVDLHGSDGCAKFAEKIISSYDPAIETDLLRKEPKQFDRLRAEYKYRKEV